MLTQTPYNEIVSQNGMDMFYLFWALGSIQDDFIDTLPKNINSEPAERRKQIGLAIFGPDKKFYRGVFYLLQEKVINLNLGDKQKDYIHGKIVNWYRFLVRQEADVLGTTFDNFTFDYCRNYRENQNHMAGETLVATLNGTKCLDAKKQLLEDCIPQFSYLTQIIDDIADLQEDLSSERPSYAVGALIDHPVELENVRKELDKGKIKKMTPKIFRSLAPESAKLVETQFFIYRSLLETALGKQGKGLSILASVIYKYYPYVRDFLYNINPTIANF